MPAPSPTLAVTPASFEQILSRYTSDYAEPLRWLYYLARDKGWSLKQISQQVGRDGSTWSKVFRDKYEGSLDKVISDIQAFQITWEQGRSAANPDFIETSLAKRLFFAGDKARATRSVVLAWGDMGIGKTVVTKRYLELNNHGKTRYLRCPAAVAKSGFLAALSRATGNNAKGSQDQQLRAIIRTLGSGNKLLIIDELHQIFLGTRSDTAIRVAEIIRQIYDEAECGLLLVGTRLLKQEFDSGQHAPALAQLRDRGTIVVDLPSKPTAGDIRAFQEHYGLPEPTGEAAQAVKDILRTAGLRKLTLHLRDGAAAAERANEEYTWEHFLKARATLAKLAGS